MYLLYSALLGLVLVIASPYWVWEMLRHRKYRKGLWERLGFVPARVRKGTGKCVWIHAVSVGEVLAINELVRVLREELPQYRVVVSTTTDAGQKLAAARFGPENVFYFPLDFAFAVRRWFRALRPDLVVVAETEFWPNFLRVAVQLGARVAVVNARISDRSLTGYRRWRMLLRGVLDRIDVFLAQTPEDAQRLVEIGAPAGRVRVAGNLKYDAPLMRTAEIVDRLRAGLAKSGARPVLACGSTVEGEEALLVSAFKAVVANYSDAVMLLAPRHPERFDEVAGILRELQARFQRRSEWQGEPLNGSVLLIDSIGELPSLYALADIAFVGGSLVPRGGHNVIEPAQHGVAILVGKHTENFRDIVNFFLAHDALRVVEALELAPAFLQLVADEHQRRAMGKRAADALESQRGATLRALNELKSLLPQPTRTAEPA